MMMSDLHVRPDVLADALKAVKPALAARSANTALSGVRIKAADGGESATMYATDYDVGVCKTIPLWFAANGDMDVVLSHAELAKAAKLVKGQVVRLALDDATATIEAGPRAINLRSLRLEDHPGSPMELPHSARTLTLHAEAADLAAYVKRAATFASTDETRPILTAIRLDAVANDVPVMCATDSYRLGIFKLHGCEVIGEAGINLPARLLKLATKGTAGEVTLEYDGRTVFITNHVADEVWHGRAIEGQYPNYSQLIPDEFEHLVRVPTAEWKSACELAVAFSTGKAPLRLNVNGTTFIHGKTPDGPTYREELPRAQHLRVDHGRERPAEDDDVIEIGLNPGFALDVANVTRSSSMAIRLISPMRPALVEDGDDRFLLMPIRLNV